MKRLLLVGLAVGLLTSFAPIESKDRSLVDGGFDLVPAAETEGGARFCFLLSGSTTIDTTYDGSFLSGTATDPVCGTGPLLGDLVGTNFLIHTDWPAGPCVDGVWYTGKTSDLS